MARDEEEGVVGGDCKTQLWLLLLTSDNLVARRSESLIVFSVVTPRPRHSRRHPSPFLSPVSLSATGASKDITIIEIAWAVHLAPVAVSKGASNTHTHTKSSDVDGAVKSPRPLAPRLGAQHLIVARCPRGVACLIVSFWRSNLSTHKLAITFFTRRTASVTANNVSLSLSLVCGCN